MTDQNERSEFVGSDEVAMEDGAEDSAVAATPDSEAEATSCCGPGCDCGSAPTGRKAVKTVVTVLVLLGVVAALVYGRTGNTKQTAADQMAAGSGSAFSVAQAAQEPAAGPAAQSPQGMVQGQGAGRIGDNLGSMSDLNKVAMSQDAVFIYVPGSGTESAAGQTQTAVRAAQKALTSKHIALGLYTLPTSSPDYPALSKQLSGPAIIVASKGHSMAAVSGEVTEDKLLQAFVASQRSGGCGCAPGASCPAK